MPSPHTGDIQALAASGRLHPPDLYRPALLRLLARPASASAATNGREPAPGTWADALDYVRQIYPVLARDPHGRVGRWEYAADGSTWADYDPAAAATLELAFAEAFAVGAPPPPPVVVAAGGRVYRVDLRLMTQTRIQLPGQTGPQWGAKRAIRRIQGAGAGDPGWACAGLTDSDVEALYQRASAGGARAAVLPSLKANLPPCP